MKRFRDVIDLRTGLTDDDTLVVSFLAENCWVLVKPNGAFLRKPGHMSYLKFPSQESAEAEAHRLGYTTA